MSLLEDVFLEDEAGEAERLERVIEGDEYEDVQNVDAENSDENSEKEDEAQEDKRRVDPTKPKRVVKNPRFVLNPARLTGPRGIQVIPDHFKDFKFKGKGHEKEDLDMVLKKLEHWAYRLYPKFEFSDCLKKIESLGKKRPVMVHLHKIRTDQYQSDEIVEQKDSSDEEEPQKPEEDEFDKLLQEQIELARATPAPASIKKPAFTTPMPDRSMPKATSSPSISNEQRERMLRNRQLAEERRLAKLKMQETKIQEPIANTEKENNDNIANETSPDIQMTQVTNTNKEVSKFNINESPDTSDSEFEMRSVNQSITVDIHEKSLNEVTDVEMNPVNSEKTSNNNLSENITDKISSKLNDSTDLGECLTRNEGVEITNEENIVNEDIETRPKNQCSSSPNVNMVEIVDDTVSESNKEESHLSTEIIDDTNVERTELNTKSNITEDITEVNSINETEVNAEIDKESKNTFKDSDSLNEKGKGKILKDYIRSDDKQESELIDDEIMDIDFSDDF